MNQKPSYPKAKTVDQHDQYFGTNVADPYRWLENADGEDTAQWVKAETQVTDEWLAAIPDREKISKRITSLMNYERYPNNAFGIAGAMTWAGRTFVFRNSGLQNQYVLYTGDQDGKTVHVLLDPNTLRSDGTAALTGLVPSTNGKFLAYALAQAGSDWSEWRVRDLDSGKDLADLIPWTKFSLIGWTEDNKGFYYTRYPEPASDAVLTGQTKNGKVYYHRLGEPIQSDSLVHQDSDHPTWTASPGVSDDGQYLLITVDVNDYSKNLLLYRDLAATSGKTIALIAKPEYLYTFVGSEGTTFYLQTTDGAAKGRVIAVDLGHPEPAHWREIIPEQADLLESVTFADGKFVASYLKDAHAKAIVFDRQGQQVANVHFPGLGTVTWSMSRQSDTVLTYSFTGFTEPTSIYHYDLRTNQSSEFKKSKVNFDPKLYSSEQVFYTSKDGTRVPMFLVHRRDLAKTRENPTILYGYGGFNIPMTPSFVAPYVAWMEMGGVVAIANLRGGSEYGEDWHLAGSKLNKQHVFDDFMRRGRMAHC